MRFRLGAVIGRALESARTVLRDLDADQVPARLRRVVAHAGALTPPLADLLAKEMDRLDWLREKAATGWPDADVATDGPDRASALFLLRPEGWAIELAKIVGEQASVTSKDIDRDDGKRDRDLAVAREKLKVAVKEATILKRRVAELEQAQRQPDRARAAADARESEALAAAATAHAAEVARLQRAIEEATAAAERAKEAARQARRDRAAMQRSLDAVRHTGSWADRDPIDLAVHLDAVAAQARPRAEHSADDGTLPPFVLPSGVRPDSAEAIDAVLRAGVPLAVFVDGYNAGLTLGPGSPGEVRKRLEDLLRRLRTLGGPGMTVTVVWDSSAGDDGMRLPDGLDVRFAPAGVPADDVLVDLAADTTRAVVVSNDREVRERAAESGALTLWSTALVEWSKQRR